MKKIIYLLLTFVFITGLLSANHVTKKSDNLRISKLDENIERIDFSDGSYIIITLETDPSILLSSTNSLKTGSKAAVAHHYSGKIL